MCVFECGPEGKRVKAVSIISLHVLAITTRLGLPETQLLALDFLCLARQKRQYELREDII